MKNTATLIAAVSCLLASHTAFALDSETLAIRPMPQQIACDAAVQCTPQEISGNASEEEVRKAMPSYSEAKVKEIVELMKGSTMAIEAARLCTIDLDKSTILKAQVLFD